jgi:CCR4-NOT transcription complex subunit 1
MTEGISIGGIVSEASAKESNHYGGHYQDPSIVQHQLHGIRTDLYVTGWLQIYASNLAKALTNDNLEKTLAELDSIAGEETSSKENHKAQVYFLAQLLSEFILHIETTNVPNLTNRQAKTSALETILVNLSLQHDFPTVICSSLYIATTNNEQVVETGLGTNVGLTSLVQYLTLGNALSNLGIITFTTAICSGWDSYSQSQSQSHSQSQSKSHSQSHSGSLKKSDCDSNLILDLATRILLSSLEKQDLGDLEEVLRQSILFAFLASEAIQDENSPARKIAQELSSYTVSKQSNFPNMAERLSPAAAGLITNLLAELGPACTQNVSTLRDTIRHITKGLPNSNHSAAIDEPAMARLIYFFSERGTKGPNSSSNSAALGTLTNDFDTGDGSDWNLSNVAQVFSEDYATTLIWDEVAMKFDFADFMVRDTLHLRALLNLYKAGARKTLPINAIVRPWGNKSGQLSFFENALAVTPNIFAFPLNEEEEKDAATTEDVSNGPCQNPRGWASSAVLQLMLELSEDPSVTRRVRDLFVKGLLGCPEVLFCALVRSLSSTKHGMQMKNDLMRELIPLFFTPKAQQRVRNVSATIKRLWYFSANAVVSACVEAWKSTVNDPPQSRLAVIAHIIGICRLLSTNSSNAVATILNSNNYEFNLVLAFVMTDLDMFALRPYLESRVNQAGQPNPNAKLPFIIAMIAYIERFHDQVQAEKGASLLSASNLTTTLSFLRALDSTILNQKLRSDDASTLGDSIKALSDACVKAHPSLSARMSSSPSPTPMPSSNQGSSDAIEEAANSYFQKIYTSEQSIDDVVKMLKNFKSSGESKENDIFACMIHNLFDEYRFFSKYPEKELRITGILFGKLIQEQLVSSITLGIALRYVLEALRKSPGQGNPANNASGKMFRFGMFALEQFKDRLHEWPQYCSHIVQIPHLKQGYQSLVDEIEGAMAENQNKTSSGASVGSTANDSTSMPSDKALVSGVPSTVNVQLLKTQNQFQSNGSSHSALETLPAPVPLPPTPTMREARFGPGLGRAVTNMNEDVQHEAPNNNALDRVQQLMNNVTMTNVVQSASDLKDILEPKNFGWLGQYLVVKRISTQPNFHSVYLAFLDHLGDYGRGLIDAILSSVYLNVGSLLRSPEITTSTSQRSLLKNLGSWLGQITLARNRPIMQITLDCKELLYQGYETGRLFAVTPFVAKILEGAKNSVVFRPPNPWLMGLLSVFRSLYEVEDLKMNIKFEVEVLCKNLGLKLDEIPLRTEDLAKRVPPIKTANPDFNMKSSMASAPVPSAGQSTPSAEGKSGGNISTSGASAAVALQLGSPSPSGSGSKDQQTVIPNLASYVTINPQLIVMFQQLGSSCNLDNATLKRNVPIAVDRAIREIIQPVVERSVTIACITTKEIVTKDFAMESDENKMRKAAQLMVANLAGSLALVACREPLKASVSNHLRQLLISAATNNASGTGDPSSTQLSEPVQNAVDQCVSVCSQENLELGCTLIEKAATEKAVRDIDESLGADLMKRKRHREIGKAYYDMSIFGNADQRYPAALPEPLRPKPGGLRNEQLLVYEAFQRIPRQPSAQEQTSSAGANPATAGGAAPGPTSGKTGVRFSVDVISGIAMKLENAVTALLTQVGPRAPEITLSRIPMEHEIKQLLVASKQMTTSVAASGALTSLENDSALGFAQTIFKRLYELRLSEPLRLEAFVALLESLNICCRQLGKDLGTWATYAPTDTDAQRKLHRTVLLLLLRSKLLQVTELDSYLCERVNGGRNVIWLEFTMAFIRTAVHEKIVDPKELPKTMSALMELSKSGGQSSQIAQLLRAVEEISSVAKDRNAPDTSSVKSTSAPSTDDPVFKPTHQQSSSISAASLSNLAEATTHARELIESISRDDPAGLKERIVMLLDGWMRIINDVGNNEKMLQYVLLLQQHGIGNNEEQSERFFRVSTELLVTAVLKESKNQKALNYSVIDGYGKLILTLMKHLNTNGKPEEVAKQRISLLDQILGVTMRTMMAHYERSKRDSGNGSAKWDQRPWFRLLLNLVMDLNSPSPVFDPISYGILSVFGRAFHVVQPLVIPGFAFAWLELVSHRMFLSNLLSVKGQKGWAVAHSLLIDLFLFLEPHLRKIDLTDSMRQLYKGTMRVLLVLLHDYPAFLAGYHLSFCNVIPENCVQLRNLVLSAFPRGMVLPDPFTPNLKIDIIPEMSKSPLVLSNVVGPITTICEELDDYLKNRQSPEFIRGLLPRLYKDGTKEVDSGKVNALVLYVGIKAIEKQQSSQVSHRTAEMEILQKLMDFDDRGRYISLNAIANQLRFPSSHTHYFSCVILFLFSEAKDEGVREQVTRVLLERLIVHRPHPWGLLVTFIELIKNQRYQFWSHPFTRCATEIEKVFESVARSCLTPGSQKTTSVGGSDVL